MQPIHELLDRIRWDTEFGAAEFAVGYYDRVLKEETIVPFRPGDIESADRQKPRTFVVCDGFGIVHRVPLHRIRTVYRNGAVIWHRPASEPR